MSLHNQFQNQSSQNLEKELSINVNGRFYYL